MHFFRNQVIPVLDGRVEWNSGDITRTIQLSWPKSNSFGRSFVLPDKWPDVHLNLCCNSSVSPTWNGNQITNLNIFRIGRFELVRFCSIPDPIQAPSLPEYTRHPLPYFFGRIRSFHVLVQTCELRLPMRSSRRPLPCHALALICTVHPFLLQMPRSVALWGRYSKTTLGWWWVVSIPDASPSNVSISLGIYLQIQESKVRVRGTLRNLYSANIK